MIDMPGIVNCQRMLANLINLSHIFNASLSDDEIDALTTLFRIQKGLLKRRLTPFRPVYT